MITEARRMHPGMSNYAKWLPALLILMTSALTGCAVGGGAQSDQAFMGGAVNLQLDVRFKGGGKPEGPAPGNLVAALKSPNKQGRWQPAIFLYSEQSVTIEARISGQSKPVKVPGAEVCCTVTKDGDKVIITAPEWTEDQKQNKAYPFALEVSGKVIDPIIIPR